MRLIPWGSTAPAAVVGAAWCAGAIVAGLSLTGQAGQLRSVTDGVYSTAQAARGQLIYQAQCADCHGGALEGASGPPLAGAGFLANWSARPIGTLVDKVQKTMPFSLPGSLSRQQSTDLTAFILQGGRFAAGQAELTDAASAQVVFPTASRPAAPAAAPGAGATASLAPPEGNLAELMRAIAFPNSNIIFNLQLKDPGAQPKKPTAAAPFDYVEWGSTVYGGWLAVDQAAIALTETAALFLTPGRLCQNGRAVPVERADWRQFVAALSDAGKLAHRASQARNFEAFVDISEKVNDACANCHKAYRDKGGAEGSGGNRCQ
ncbi:MAG: cytochrome c [Acidobacteriota bacterium]